MDQIINHAVLSLDFWQDTVTYEGSTMPTGTIGCEVLNIPDSTIEKLDTPCNVLNQLLQGMNTGSVDMELLPQVQQAAGEIISFLQVTPPFSRLNRSYFEQKLAVIFSEKYMEDAKAYLQLTQQEQLICALTGQHSKATMLVRIAQVLGHLSYSLGQYKEALTKFAERLNEPGYDRRALVADRQSLIGLQNFCLGRCKYTVKATQHSKGQNHLTVFALFEIATQQIGYAPYKIGLFIDVHISAPSSLSLLYRSYEITTFCGLFCLLTIKTLSCSFTSLKMREAWPF